MDVCPICLVAVDRREEGVFYETYSPEVRARARDGLNNRAAGLAGDQPHLAHDAVGEEPRGGEAGAAAP